MIGRDHNSEAFRGDLINDALAGRKAVKTAQLVGNDVDLIDLVDGHSRAVDDRLSLFRFLRIRRAIGPHGPLGVHQTVHRDLTAQGDLIVVEVVRTGDLHRTGAEIGIRILIGDDRDQAAVFLRTNRNFAELADDWLVALVRRVNGHRAVAQHGFRAGGGDGDVVPRLAQGDVAVLILLDILIGLPAGQRVLEVPHVAVGFDVLDLKVGNRRFELRIPVDQPLVLVDQAFLVEINEDLQHRIRQVRRHGELGRDSSHTTHQDAQLTEDRAFRLAFLFPDPLDEGLTAHVAAARLVVRGKLTLDNHLRCNARVVGARLPQNVIALHAFPADRISCSVLFSAWPMCREPVTFGGGITMVKASAPSLAPAPALKASAFSQVS
jgi:hypothetical protein